MNLKGEAYPFTMVFLHLNSYVISSFIWLSMQRKRKLLSPLIYAMKGPFIRTKLHASLLLLICGMPIFFTTIGIIKRLLPNPHPHLLYGAKASLETELIILSTKCFLKTCIYPTLTNLVVLLYCLICQKICRSINILTVKIEVCSPKTFTSARQEEILRCESKIIDLIQVMHKVFSIPSFLIFIAHFCTCITVVGIMVKQDSSESYIVLCEFVLYISNSFGGLLACLWMAGGLPTEAGRFKEAFRRKMKQRLLCIRKKDEICFQEETANISDFVLSGCDIIFFRRSSILALAGTILTYAILLMTLNS
ncbi:hypothetical protein AVEN_144206-1 [Araneus ventricosus]|uniref:Gustatory receptor n=1 Tax=Araneus ventricosus TaxID=182803 RepID=A0A4Y2HTC7_ARAVE|nr:hypothetical protein AVEN_144206-1 [Araneus ventricosus]